MNIQIKTTALQRARLEGASSGILEAVEQYLKPHGLWERWFPKKRRGEKEKRIRIMRMRELAVGLIPLSKEEIDIDEYNLWMGEVIISQTIFCSAHHTEDFTVNETLNRMLMEALFTLKEVLANAAALVEEEKQTLMLLYAK